MANTNPVKIRPLSLPNIMGIGPIIIIPPVCTSDVFEVDCSIVPINMSTIPMNRAIIPAMIMVFAFM